MRVKFITSKRYGIKCQNTNTNNTSSKRRRKKKRRKRKKKRRRRKRRKKMRKTRRKKRKKGKNKRKENRIWGFGARFPYLVLLVQKQLICDILSINQLSGLLKARWKLRIWVPFYPFYHCDVIRGIKLPIFSKVDTNNEF